MQYNSVHTIAPQTMKPTYPMHHQQMPHPEMVPKPMPGPMVPVHGFVPPRMMHSRPHHVFHGPMHRRMGPAPPVNSPTPPLEAPSDRSTSSTPSTSAAPSEVDYSAIFSSIEELVAENDEDETALTRQGLQADDRSSGFIPNSHPVPYIPTIVRKRALADPVRCGIDIPAWLPQRGWTSYFRAGSVQNRLDTRRLTASRIVEAGPWDTSVMSELAAKFVERAAEGNQDYESNLQYVAPFASEVYEYFKRMEGEQMAELFKNQLKQCLLSEFRAWWLPRLPSAVANLPCVSSPPHAPPLVHLSSALGIAIFVSDLFTYSLASSSFVLLCLNMLLDKLSVVEEVRAIYEIISHADARLYERARLNDFLAELQASVARIPEGATATGMTGTTHVREQVNMYVQAVAQIIASWAAERETPEPSECSSASTEYSDHNPDFIAFTKPDLIHVSRPPRHLSAQNIPSAPPGLSLPSAQSDEEVTPKPVQTRFQGSSSQAGSALVVNSSLPGSGSTQAGLGSWAQMARA